MNLALKILLWWYIISIPCATIFWYTNGIIKSKILALIVEWTLFVLSIPSMFVFVLFMFDSLMMHISNRFLQICIYFISLVCVIVSLPAIIFAITLTGIQDLIWKIGGNSENEYNRET